MFKRKSLLFEKKNMAEMVINLDNNRKQLIHDLTTDQNN